MDEVQRKKGHGPTRPSRKPAAIAVPRAPLLFLSGLHDGTHAGDKKGRKPISLISHIFPVALGLVCKNLSVKSDDSQLGSCFLQGFRWLSTRSLLQASFSSAGEILFPMIILLDMLRKKTKFLKILMLTYINYIPFEKLPTSIIIVNLRLSFLLLMIKNIFYFLTFCFKFKLLATADLEDMDSIIN